MAAKKIIVNGVEVRRGPGRPRKETIIPSIVEDAEVIQKRGRGRPRRVTDPSLQSKYQQRKIALTRHELHAKRKALYYPVRLPVGGWDVKGMRLPPCNLTTILLFAFKHAESPEEKEFLFWEIADLLWNKDPDDRRYAKHKWSYTMIHHACREKYLAIGGAGSSGKSYTMAGWGVVNWLADPENTLVLFTSTDLKGAKARIWGAMTRLLRLVPDAPCVWRESTGVIAFANGDAVSDTAGIRLVTADKSSSKDKVGKLIGIKAKKVILIADELGEMGPNVQSAATGNLSKNPHFQMIGLSNPASRFDPFGIFSEPQTGWDSVNNELDYQWRTKIKGLYIRLDSEQSPNIDDTESSEYEVGEFYPYLPTADTIETDLDTFGTTHEEARKSREFMRFNRAIFYDSDGEESVYSEAELLRAGATQDAVLSNPVLLAGFDPSFSSGGDKSVLTFIEEGMDQHGQHCIRLKETVYIYEDMTNKVDPRSLQIADKVKVECLRRGLKPEDLAVDASGAGGPWCDILQLQWSAGFLRVQFGGAASDRRLKNDSRITCRDRYRNRATELFAIGKQYLLGRQIYGIPALVAKQMCQRLFLPPTKGVLGMVLQVEPKGVYKARVGSSPDELDSFLVAVELARARHMFIPADPVAVRENKTIAAWLRPKRTLRDFAADRCGHVAHL